MTERATLDRHARFERAARRAQLAEAVPAPGDPDAVDDTVAATLRRASAEDPTALRDAARDGPRARRSPSCRSSSSASPTRARRNGGSRALGRRRRRGARSTSPTCAADAARARRQVEVDGDARRSTSTRRSRPPACEVVETDLGEYIIQLGGRGPVPHHRPGHPPRPRTRSRELSRARRRPTMLGDEPEALTALRPRAQLRESSCAADVGITGVQLRRRRDRLDRAGHERGQRPAVHVAAAASTSR